MIFQILTSIVLPLFALMGVGVLADKVLRLDLSTLSQLNFYLFVPALVFIKLSESQIDPASVGNLLAFNLVHMLLLMALCYGIFWSKQLRSQRPVLVSAALFNNCGNYGLPLAYMAFGSRGVEIMAIILVFQNVASFTVGLWLIGSNKEPLLTRIKQLLLTPVLLAVILAIVVHFSKITLPEILQFPLTQIGNALVPVALITLGVQLSRTRWAGNFKPLVLVCVSRLFLAPILAVLLGWFWISFISPDLQQALPVLIAGASLPVAVNITILALQYNRDPELASLAVFWSTLVSAVTMTLWLYFCIPLFK